MIHRMLMSAWFKALPVSRSFSLNKFKIVFKITEIFTWLLVTYEDTTYLFSISLQGNSIFIQNDQKDET